MEIANEAKARGMRALCDAYQAAAQSREILANSVKARPKVERRRK